MKNLIILFLLSSQLFGQNNSFKNFKKYPFPTELCSSSTGSKLAWAMDEQGKRNIYVTETPDFKARKITNYNQDDGQELSFVSLSNDGKWVVFSRGGDHGSNWDDGLPLNPTFTPMPNNVKIEATSFSEKYIKNSVEGDYPKISPNNKTVAFIKNGQVWAAPIDSLSKAKNLFITRGTVTDLEWNPDGNSLLFVSDRGDHSIIGIYKDADSPIKWVAPSFSIDNSPRWSPDGQKIVFIREPGKGGSPEPMLVKSHNSWAIYTADITTSKETLVWKATNNLRGSLPTTHGGPNLHWAANNKIVFLSYQDGWPHLYSIDANGGKELLLTSGNFMCEHIKLSTDRKYLTFSANTGNDKLDIERRHIGMVSVDKADLQILSNGNGNEWTPVLFNESKAIAYISSSAQRPPLVTIKNLNTNENEKLIGEELIPTDFPNGKLVTPKQVVFKSLDGLEIHADLFLPENGLAKKPAIVYVHGGPPRQMLLGWHYSDYYSNAYAANQYLASLGYVVLAVNYRLGIGYGYEFHQAPHSGINGADEYLDIKAAGLWLQKQSFVNASKIGIYGGSYGGYLTAMALAKDSKIFSAGVDIHGVHDWGENTKITSKFDGKTEKAPDYELAIKTAWLSSPVAYINTWTSPVLIIHGDDDRNVKFNQSTDLIKRLDKKGVPYETIMIVDDSHHWMKWENAVKVYGETADFFNRKLK